MLDFLADKSWESIIWESILVWACITTVVFAVFVLNLPSQYDPYRKDLIEEDNFREEDKKNAESGYGYFAKHRDTNKTLKVEASVTVLVLGDIGRSPRMQYHVASIARHGGRVSLIGYVESQILPEIVMNRFVKIIPLKPIPQRLRTSSKLLFPIVAPLKVLYQVWDVWRTCGYHTKPTKWMLVQNPPSIPTLLLAQFICFVRNTKLIIDWHNFGYTILALKLGDGHPLVRISEFYERYVARWADVNFCVTNAMARVLKQRFGIDALPLHDRPAKQFQPLTPEQRSEVLHRLEGTKSHAKKIEEKRYRLLVSSTSWTADEDFSLLLDALVVYSSTVSMDPRFPKILAIITGKGPDKDYYLSKLDKLKAEKRLTNVIVKTAWLSSEDYASLLGAADIGVSLHKSSSGVDLPMKVVDMFGTGLPVFGYSKFEAWPELVRDGVNGMGFETADELEELLEKAFTGNGHRLNKLRDGALKETKRRWDDEWFPVAGRILKMGGTTLESDPRPQEEKSTSSLSKEAEAPALVNAEQPVVSNEKAIPVTTENDAPVEQVVAPSSEALREEQQVTAEEPTVKEPAKPIEEPAEAEEFIGPIEAEKSEEQVQPAQASIILEEKSEEQVQPVQASTIPEETSEEKPRGGTFLSYAPMRPDQD